MQYMQLLSLKQKYNCSYMQVKFTQTDWCDPPGISGEFLSKVK